MRGPMLPGIMCILSSKEHLSYVVTILQTYDGQFYNNHSYACF